MCVTFIIETINLQFLHRSTEEVFNSVGFMLCQMSRTRSTSDGVRLLTLTLSLTILFLVSLYQGCLLTLLLLPTAPQQINTLSALADVLQSGKYRLVVYNDGVAAETIDKSNDAVFIRIREILQRYPLKRITSHHEIIEAVTTLHGIYLTEGMNEFTSIVMHVSALYCN
jgi:hypothetical protein